MPIHTIHLTTPLHRTFRTEQVACLFDRLRREGLKLRLLVL